MQVPRNLFLILFWCCLISLSSYFYVENVLIYFQGFRSRLFGNTFFNNQFWVVSHLVGGSITLFLGPMQFWKGLRTRYAGFHRTSGKLYITGAFITGISALRLSLISSCQPCRVSLFILAVLIILTTSAAWYAVKNRNIKAHRQFMVRSYVTVLSFVAVRIDGILPMSFLFGHIEDPTFNRTVNEYFFSFVPLLVTEIIMNWLPPLQRRTSTQRKPGKGKSLI